MRTLISFLSIILCLPTPALAAADFDPNAFNTPASASTPALTEKKSTAVGLPSMGGGGINPNAGVGQGSQKGGAGDNSGAGAALMAAGAAMMAMPPTMPIGAILLAMGAMAMKQSDEDDNAAGQSAATGYSSLSGGSNPSSSSSGDAADAPKTGAGGFNSAKAKAKEAEQKLKEAGYELTNKGLVTPEGKLIPNSSFNSASAMAAAGLPQAAIDESQKILSPYNSAARLSAITTGVRESGEAGPGASREPASEPPTLAGAFNAFDSEAQGRFVAGKTVMFNGEPIGVAGQNIFEAIHNCYDRKRSGRHFLEE